MLSELFEIQTWHCQELLKNVYFIIFFEFFHCKHFYFISGFGKKMQSLQVCKLQILEVQYKSFPMMNYLSYLDIKNGGGCQIDPPPKCILVFKYPSRDRVKSTLKCSTKMFNAWDTLYSVVVENLYLTLNNTLK